MSIRIFSRILQPVVNTLNFLSPMGDLLVRIWIAHIFFAAGLLKIESWQTTLNLFTYEYNVPLLSPYAGAMLGTAAELVLPVLLVLGLGGRICILIFFIYNAIAAISYPFLWTPQGEMGLEQHINWGLLLMILAFHGSGKLSVDYWLHKKNFDTLKTDSQ